jgi:putative membrane protein
MRNTVSAALVALAVAAPAGVAGAADRASINFMRKASVAGMAEVQLGRLAVDRSGDREIRRFAQQMVDDHSRANDELMRLARNEGVTLPVGLDRAHRQVYDRLRRLNGNAFDRAYMDQMNVDHQAAVALFRTQARSSRDRDVRDWAARTLPALQHHHTMARDLRRDERREVRGR